MYVHRKTFRLTIDRVHSACVCLVPKMGSLLHLSSNCKAWLAAPGAPSENCTPFCPDMLTSLAQAFTLCDLQLQSKCSTSDCLTSCFPNICNMRASVHMSIVPTIALQHVRSCFIQTVYQNQQMTVGLGFGCIPAFVHALCADTAVAVCMLQC